MGEVLNGVPQGPFLGLLLFNIFLNDILLSLQKCDLANYASDSTLYTSDKSISNTINSLSDDFTILSQWFHDNFMVLNPDKCSFMLLGLMMSFKLIWCVGMKLLKTVNKKKY